jgi:hypothetical protein
MRCQLVGEYRGRLFTERVRDIHAAGYPIRCCQRTVGNHHEHLYELTSVTAGRAATRRANQPVPGPSSPPRHAEPAFSGAPSPARHCGPVRSLRSIMT